MGFLYSAWSGLLLRVARDSSLSASMYPPPNKFDVDRDVPDQSGKIVLVTGGASGVGYQASKHLLAKNAKVYVAGRNASKVEAAIDALERETGRRAVALQLDLADLDSVKACAVDFANREERLDILLCNAGIMGDPPSHLTAQGYDAQFTTNVLGHHLLTTLLIPALLASTKLTGTKARVVQTSSDGHKMAPGDGIDFDSLKAGPARNAVVKKWGSTSAPWALYGQSKVGNIMYANWLDREHGRDIVSSSIHPGMLDTNLGENVPRWQMALLRMFVWPKEYAGINILYAATAPEGEGFGGKHIIPWARLGKADKRSDNVQLQDKLVAWMDEEVKPWLE